MITYNQITWQNLNELFGDYFKFKKALNSIGLRTSPKYKDVSFENDRANIEANIVVGAFDEGRLVGIGTLRTHQNWSGEVGTIEDVFVLPGAGYDVLAISLAIEEYLKTFLKS